MLLDKVTLKAKHGGLSQAKLDNLQDMAKQRYTMEAVKGSTAVDNKQYEIIVRHLMNAHGIQIDDFRARSMDKTDIVIRVNGKSYNLEVKSGLGPIAYCEAQSKHNDRNADEVFPDADIVIYYADVKKISCEDDILDNSIAVTRDEFIDYIIDNAGKRSHSFKTATKWGQNNKAIRGTDLVDAIYLQAAYTDQRQEACESGMYTTLRTLLEELGRA